METTELPTDIPVCSMRLLGRNPAMKWLDGEISLGKLLKEHRVPLDTGSELVGCLWQAFEQRAHDLNEALVLKSAAAKKLSELSASGDTERTTPEDARIESARSAAFLEARQLLQFHILSGIANTRAAV